MEEAIPGVGIFTEGSVVLIEGEYTDEERIKVDQIGHPPSETREVARQMCAHIDFLGTGAISKKEEKDFKYHEQVQANLCMVVISDLHLDHPKTMANFRKMLQGYVEVDFLPFVFILCGNFSSSPFVGGDPIKRYQGESELSTGYSVPHFAFNISYRRMLSLHRFLLSTGRSTSSIPVYLEVFSFRLCSWTFRSFQLSSLT